MEIYLSKKLKDQSHKYHNRKSGEMASRIFETYKNSVMPYGRHIHKILAKMAISTMCKFPSDLYALTHWKFVLSSFKTCPSIVTPLQEYFSDSQNSCPKIHFHVS